MRRRVSLVFSAVAAILGALAGLIPFVVVYLVAVDLFVSETPRTDRITSLVVLAAAGVAAKVVLRAVANWLSHVTAYRALADLRLELADRIDRMPLREPDPQCRRTQEGGAGRRRAARARLVACHSGHRLLHCRPTRHPGCDVLDRLANGACGGRDRRVRRRVYCLGGGTQCRSCSSRIRDRHRPECVGCLLCSRHSCDPRVRAAHEFVRRRRARGCRQRGDRESQDVQGPRRGRLRNRVRVDQRPVPAPTRSTSSTPDRSMSPNSCSSCWSVWDSRSR